MPTTAMSAVALTQSTIAMQQAYEAEVRSCKALIGSYHAETATTSQMQEYARCVSLVYPNELSAGDITGLKIVLLIAFIGLGLGLWKAKNDSWCDGLFDYAMFALIGFFALPIGLGIIGWMIYGLAWLVGIA